MVFKKYLIIIIQLIFLLHSNIILCYQLKITLKNQIYQFPINHNLYRRLRNNITNKNNIRELSYYEYEKPSKKLALPIIYLDIGFPFQNFELIYSTGKHSTWLYRYKANDEKLNQKYFDKKLSKTLFITNEHYEINYFTFGTLCEKVSDFISIDNLTSIFTSFMLVYYLAPNSLFADGEFGLARKYLGIYSDPYITKNVSNYSFIEGLYNENKIDKKIFAHKWVSEKEGILYIGEYPLLKKEIPYYDFYTCKSSDKFGEINQYWNCYINGIKIGNKYIDYSLNEEIGIFSTGEKFIFIPEERIDIINYIKNYSDWGKERTDAYYAQWENGITTTFIPGPYVDLFKSSDALIHDCHSFIVEYLYTKKPVLYLANFERESQCNEVGKKAFACHYQGTTKEDVIQFIDEIVLGEKDTMSQVRRTFYDTILVPPHGLTVAENIVNEIISEINSQ